MGRILQVCLALMLAAVGAYHIKYPDEPTDVYFTSVGHDYGVLVWRHPEYPGHSPVTGSAVWMSKNVTNKYTFRPPSITGNYTTADGERLLVCQKDTRIVAWVEKLAGSYTGLVTAEWSEQAGGFAGYKITRNGVEAQMWYPHAKPGIGLLGLVGEGPSYTAFAAAEVLRGSVKQSVCDMMLPMKDIERVDCARYDGIPEACEKYLRYCFVAWNGDCKRIREIPVEKYQRSTHSTYLEFPEDSYDITGHYFSSFNESISICSGNGSFVAAYSGLKGYKGFATGHWNDFKQMYVGGYITGLTWSNFAPGQTDWLDEFKTMHEGPLEFELDHKGVLRGHWQAFNRTWDFEIDDYNRTIEPDWYADPDPNLELSGFQYRETGTQLTHTTADGCMHQTTELGCTNIKLATGPSLCKWVEDKSSCEVNLLAALPLSSLCGMLGFRPPGGYPEVNTTKCDTSWNATKEELDYKALFPNGTWTDTRTTGELLACVNPDLPIGPDGGIRKAPRVHLYEFTRYAAWHSPVVGLNTTKIIFPLKLGDQYRFRVTAANKYGYGFFSWPTGVITPVVTGPGPPSQLWTDHVGTDSDINSLTLEWQPPEDNEATGYWHSDGGSAITGYVVYMHTISDPVDRLVMRTKDLATNITQLRPQTLYYLTVAAANALGPGINSSTFIVSTPALRAVLYPHCNYTTDAWSHSQYEGCFYQWLHTTDMAYKTKFLWDLTPARCGEICKQYTYFALQAGGYCMCGHTYGRYGSVPDSHCNVDCSGDNTVRCGGYNRSSVYRQAGYWGWNLGAGDYKLYDMLQLHIEDNDISSIHLPPGLSLEIFQHNHYEGDKKVIGTSVACLAGHMCDAWTRDPWNTPCTDNDWNDNLSSLKLRYTGLQPLVTPKPNNHNGAMACIEANRKFRLPSEYDELEPDKPRPFGPITVEWRAPRPTDNPECVLQRGSFTSFQECLQRLQPGPDYPHVSAPIPTAYQQQQEYQIRHDPSLEHQRLQLEKYMHSMRMYAKVLFDNQVEAGLMRATANYTKWFDHWMEGFRGVEHLLRTPAEMRGEVETGPTKPSMGMSKVGDFVTYSENEAPELPPRLQMMAPQTFSTAPEDRTSPEKEPLFSKFM